MKVMSSNVMLRQHALLLMVFLMLLAIVSCHARATDSEQNAAPAQRPSVNDPSPAASSFLRQEKDHGIRQVDFRNFTYPWYPSYLKPPQGERQITLRDGKFEIERDENRGIDNLILELQDVSYVDLTRNLKEDAIVTVGGVAIFNKFVDAIFVYTLENNAPVVLWKHETRDRADGGLRRISVQNRVLTVEEYVGSEGDGGLCCPKIYVRSNYRWNGSQLEKIKSETLPNEYKTAEFLGYASSHP